MTPDIKKKNPQKMDINMQNWLLSQASCYIEYQQSRKAIILLEAIRKLDAKNINVHRMLSYAYLEDGRTDDCISAADTFLKYAQKGSDTRAIRWIRGRARLRRKQA